MYMSNRELGDPLPGPALSVGSWVGTPESYINHRSSLQVLISHWSLLNSTLQNLPEIYSPG